MDFEKLQDFAVANFSQYFSVTVNTMIQPTLHFAPVAVEESGREVSIPASSVGSRLNPQLVAFAVLSMFLGLTMNSLITKAPENRQTFFLAEVVGLLFWVIYAVIVHVLCKVFRGKGSFYETVSVTIQIFATLYVVCSTVATMLAMIVLLKPIKSLIAGLGSTGELIADYPTVLFFLIHTLLFVVYLPRALKPVHRFKLWQEIGVAIPAGSLVLLQGIAMIFLTGNLWSADPSATASSDRGHPVADLSATNLAQPAGPDRVRFRVLTLNMGGLRYPPRLGWMADQSDCAGRFKAVGSQIRMADPPYDLVAIQEFYHVPDLHIVTCDPTPFLEALGKADPHRILFSPQGHNWGLEADGGLAVLTRHSIDESEAVRFAGSGGPFLAARGVVFARIGLSDSSLKVDAYVVHLSPGHRNSAQRERELETLSTLIAARSTGSRNPVIVLGDFNIEGPPHAGGEYGTILRLLSTPRDLWLENGLTGAGYTFDCFRNALAAQRGCDYQARIDYIWLVRDLVPGVGGYEITGRRVRRVEWHTGGQKMLPVSDHYGLEALLSIERGADRLQ